MTSFHLSFRGDAKHRARNLEIPGLVLSDQTRNDGANDRGALRPIDMFRDDWKIRAA
jgi:hypothetical protein